MTTDGSPGAPAATGEGAGERPDLGARPWYRNPFVVAFVAGVITLTWLHFRLRRVPEPPPEFGALAVEDWVDGRGTPLERPFGDRVTVVAFADPVDDIECGGPRLVAKLRPMFESGGVDVAVAVVALGGVADPKDRATFEAWIGGPRPGAWVGGPSTAAGAAALAASLEAARAPFEAWRAANPRPPAPVVQAPPPECDGAAVLGYVAIVDGAGAVRGLFDAWDWEIESEVYHRARHVLDAQHDAGTR